MLSRIFAQNDVPKEYRSNFIHLYLDIGWFGILSGSAVNFLNIYAVRLGATSLQIGLIAAMSAVVSLFLAIPAGQWIEKRHTGHAVFWSSVFYRLGYFLLIPLPWLLSDQAQIQAIIAITFFMAIPLTPLGVGFNALFAEAVPDEYRAHVAGIRNITFSITFMLTSLGSGYLLKQMGFPVGYQFVFLIGAIGGAMSSLHLFFIKSLPAKPTATSSAPIAVPAKEEKPSRSIFSALRLDILSSPFRYVLFALLALHLTHYITTPVYPLYNVRELNLNDNQIGIGTALFYLSVTIGSVYFRRVAHRFGHKKVTGWGMVGMALYPLLLGLSHEVWQYYVTSLVGGFTWAFVGGAYANYMLERIPPDDRPSHLAWYNIILNFSILVSAIGGSAIAEQVGLAPALFIFAVLRILAGLFILRRG
jgi:MFS family permease